MLVWRDGALRADAGGRGAGPQQPFPPRRTGRSEPLNAPGGKEKKKPLDLKTSDKVVCLMESLQSCSQRLN